MTKIQLRKQRLSNKPIGYLIDMASRLCRVDAIALTETLLRTFPTVNELNLCKHTLIAGLERRAMHKNTKGLYFETVIQRLSN